jgi:hypothetical protein
MVVTFNEEYLEKLYTKGETGVKKICNIMELSNHYK